MTVITKAQVIQSIEKLPPDRLEEAWLYLEFLSAKPAASGSKAGSIPADPEGAFPELDISLETIQAIVNDDWQKRLSRLLPDF
jgi:hypothetical protein